MNKETKQMIFGVNNKGYVKTEIMVSRSGSLFLTEYGCREKFIKKAWSTDSFYYNFYETRNEVLEVLKKIKNDKEEYLRVINKNIKIMEAY